MRRPTPNGRSKPCVAEIVADVRLRGDAAVLAYTARFDGLQAATVGELEIGVDALRAAFGHDQPGAAPGVAGGSRPGAGRTTNTSSKPAAAASATANADGSLLGQKVTPLDRVGIYVPGGKAAYPSSVLMNAVPARVAGVREIVMVVPTPQGERNALVLAAAHVAGVHRVFTVGGAQAVAALAYGTATIPRVDKITGPGNIYVATRQAACLWPGRHRHDRRAERDSGAGRRHYPSRLGCRWTCSARPNTTRWRRASCWAPMRPIWTLCKQRSSGCCQTSRAALSFAPRSKGGVR